MDPIERITENQIAKSLSRVLENVNPPGPAGWNGNELQWAAGRFGLAMQRPQVSVKKLRRGNRNVEGRIAGHFPNCGAIHGENVGMADRQKPELFWDYKEQVYANQDKLNAFTIDDFARHFAQDRDLDLKKYDADVASPELQASILAGAGVAFSNDVRATPTYMVNGTTVDPGNDGKALEAYVAALLKK